MHWQTAHLDQALADLHLAARCTGADAVTMRAAPLDGRASPSHLHRGKADVTVTRDQATKLGLVPDATIATVGLDLARTPDAGAAVRHRPAGRSCRPRTVSSRSTPPAAPLPSPEYTPSLGGPGQAGPG